MVKADDIFLFVHVVEEGSFSKVAEKLELTNSVVSKRISRLEDALNVQLLHRTTRRLHLTDAGISLLDKAKQAKLLLDSAQNSVSSYSNEVRGKLKITVPAVSARLVISKAIADFCKIYPDLEIELSVNNSFVDLIAEGYDLAIRTANLADSTLIGRRLIDSRWIVCATPKYLQVHSKVLIPNDLQKHECLIYKNQTTSPENWKFSTRGIETNVQVKGRYYTNDLDSLRQAALSDFGIAYLPRALVHRELLSGELINLLENYVSKHLGIYAVYPKSKQPDKKLKYLIEHLKLAFEQKREYFF
jgi:DNA-binding transcriptional LysR family regulator